MADDDDNKTEQATPKHRNKAFVKGQFAKAPEIAIVFGLATAFCVLFFTMPAAAAKAAEIAYYTFGHLGQIEVSASSLQFWLQHGSLTVGGMVLPMLGAAMLSAVVAGGLQSGFKLTPKVLGWKWNKLNFVSGFKRLLISKDTLVRVGIDVFKLAALAMILWVALRHVFEDPIFHTPVGVLHLGEFLHDSTLFLLLRAIAACAVIAFVSYLYQHKKTEKELKMSKSDVKQEKKNADMDPKIRQAMRAMARRIMQRQMLQAVPTADVVVTNPTHFAVALKYERGRDRAPVVLAKGHNLLARRIKALALEHGVPMVENKPVARALFKFGQVGKEIPAQLYQAVAEILGFVYRAHRYYFHRLKARRLRTVPA